MTMRMGIRLMKTDSEWMLLHYLSMKGVDAVGWGWVSCALSALRITIYNMAGLFYRYRK